ncbi:MAG: hypothetical protein J6Z23_07815 [Lachnospiraceae bacterium]|nr:hypothetical protein [Lachnospiraceae bacterium]
MEGTGRGVLSMRVPGTLDEYNIGVSEQEGEEDSEPSRYLHRYMFSGPVRISRTITFRESGGKRYFIEAERARELSLFIDGKEVPLFEARTLPMPAVFEVTGLLDGTHTVAFVSDNRFLNWPRASILGSNAANSETSVNWNGLLGEVRIREEGEAFVCHADIRFGEETATVCLLMDSADESVGLLRIQSDAFQQAYEQEIVLLEDRTEVRYPDIPLREDLHYWSPEDPFLYDLHIWYEGFEKILKFGIREFTYDRDGHFQMNGRRFFVRGETNEGVFPETVYPPMDTVSWEKLYKTYKAYGVNTVYFRGYCPPEAAFEAADRAGLLVMPELSLLHPVEEEDYYKDECLQMLRAYRHHPSFAALSFGMSHDGSGAQESFEPSEALEEIFGAAVSECPGFCFMAGGTVLQDEEDKRRPPKLLFFVGGYEMLPDFREIDLFTGRLIPENLLSMQEAASKARLLPKWERLAEESGEKALQCYRRTVREIRASGKTDGIFLSGLQDMSGFGTHPHGMLNSHGVRKRFPFADPERFRAFFGDVMLAVLSDAPALEYGSALKGRVLLKNDGVQPVTGVLKFRVTGNGLVEEVTGQELSLLPGKEAVLTSFDIPLPKARFGKAEPCELALAASFGGYTDRASVFVYPQVIPVCPESVYETEYLDEDALKFLEEGGNVFLIPKVPDRRLGIPLIRFAEGHPLCSVLPGGEQAGGSWNRLMTGVTFTLPKPLRPIVYTFSLQHLDIPDCCIAEMRVGTGAVLVSGLNLKQKLHYPEARALVAAIYRYMDSYDFSPRDEMRPEDVAKMAAGMRKA